ncbi:MAG: JAB domain-containing protein, partial [Bacteroidales bacterium]|nr:JAB domain-containing protein [Bacteroidales bacterium]
KEESANIDRKAMTSPDLIYGLMVPVMRNLDHEECWAVFLNRRNHVLSKQMICSGSLENTLIDTRRIIKFAIEKQAGSIILVHNHPSGTTMPSDSDIRQTDIVRKALSVMEIKLLDHIIIAGDSFFSFAQEKVFEIR